MTFNELKEQVAILDKNLQDYNKDLEVRVVTKDPSIGARSTVGITYIGQGIDWDSGYIGIDVDTPIVTKKKQTRKKK